MFYDNENMFFDHVDATEFASGKESDAMENYYGGDAVDPLFLAVTLSGGSGQLTAVVTTADDSAFSTPVEVATFASKADASGLVIKGKLPYGLSKYVKVKITGTATGKVTAALTQNVPNE